MGQKNTFTMMDTADVIITSAVKYPLYIYIGSEDCEGCSPELTGLIMPRKNNSFELSSTYAQTIILKEINKQTQNQLLTICKQTNKFTEFGRYNIRVSNDKHGKMHCSNASFIGPAFRENTNDIIPLNLIGIVLFLLIFYHLPSIIKCFVNILSFRTRHSTTNKTKILQEQKLIEVKSTIPDTQQGSSERLRALDAFRGINVVLMVFINSGGGQYPAFKHKIWSGMNLAEFPHGWFNWTLGMSLALSSEVDRKKKSSFARLQLAFQRTTKLIILGLLVSAFTFTSNLNSILYFGVLQDLGLLYLFAVFMDLILPRSRTNINRAFHWLNILEFNTFKGHWLVLLSAAVLHNGILFGLHVPNCGRGYLGPGGRHMNSAYQNCTGGAASYVDRLIVGEHHLAKGILFSQIYNTAVPLDPNGPVGLLGQVVQVYLGILAGEILLLYKRRDLVIIYKWIFTSIILITSAWLLCNDIFDYCLIPCVGMLWTLTYTFIVSSSALILMTLLYVIIDTERLWSGWPFYYPGTNSVFIFVAHIVLKSTGFPFYWPAETHHLHLLFQHIWQTVCWCSPELTGLIMPRKNNSFELSSTYAQTIILKEIKQTQNQLLTICKQTNKFTEFGRYNIRVSNDKDGKMHCSNASFIGPAFRENTNDIIPLNLIGIVLFLLIFYHLPSIIKCFVNILSFRTRHSTTNKTKILQEQKFIEVKSTISVTQQRSSERLRALDAFRGINVVLMVFINSGGGEYPAFKHKIWSGMNLAEFPHGWFNWTLGMSLALSSEVDRKNKSSFARLQLAFQRTTKLIILGLLVSALSFTSNLNRIPYFGILQDLGLLYLFAVFMDLILPRSRNNINRAFHWLNILEFNGFKGHWLVLLSAAVLHNGILFGLHVPNCGRGYLGPGGRHMNSAYQNCTGGAASYVDRLIVGEHHVAIGIFFSQIYDTIVPLDPYGPVGLLGQIIQVYLGILAGEILLLYKRRDLVIIYKWIFTSIILITSAWLLCNDIFDYCLIPCVRMLWTLTYTFIVSSSALIMMTLLHVIIDTERLWSGWPFYYPGTNSVFIFVAHIVLMSTGFPFYWPTETHHLHLLFQHIWQTVCWVIISGIMYHKKIFLRV